MDLSQEEIKNNFLYKNGNFYWIGKLKRSKKEIAGYKNKKGYTQIVLNKQHCLLHRLVWIMHNGTIPKGFMIDHINGDKGDNRKENLRLATPSLNSQNRVNAQKNNLLGIKGVRKVGKKFYARIQSRNQRRIIGIYDSAVLAELAYDEEKLKSIKEELVE